MTEDISKELNKPETEKKKKKRQRGFAGIIWNQMKILNDSDYFKQNYGSDDLSFLLIAKDDKHAALAKIKDGLVEVDDIKNTPEALKEVKYNALLECNTEQFFALAMGKISTFGMFKLWIARKIKMHGISKLIILLKYFHVISYLTKEKIKAQKEAQTKEKVEQKGEEKTE